MMVSRRNAVSQVIGFMSLENGLVLAATGAKGMPLVVEISVAFSVLIRLHRDRYFPLPYSRAIRQRRYSCARPRSSGTPMSTMPFDAIRLVLLIPLVSAGVLALVTNYRWSSRLNVVASLVTFLASLLLLVHRPASGPLVQIDDLNIVFVVLNTFVAFTTSIFSASYIEHETRNGTAHAGLPAILPRDVPVHDVRHEPRAGCQQHRPDVGGRLSWRR